MTTDLVERLRTRAAIRRQISTRKSVQEGKPDRLADLLEEAATALETDRMAGAVFTPEARVRRGLDCLDGLKAEIDSALRQSGGLGLLPVAGVFKDVPEPVLLRMARWELGLRRVLNGGDW